VNDDFQALPKKPRSPQSSKQINKKAFVRNEESASEFNADQIESSESEVEITKVRNTSQAAEESSDSEDHFQPLLYKKTIKKQLKRVIQSSSSDLSPVDEDEEDEVKVVVPRKRQPKKPKIPKYNIFEGHPELLTVWDELRGAHEPTDIHAEQPQDILVKMLPFQLAGLSWLQRQELTRFNGGILADQMGMGKTIQMIALIVSTADVRPNLVLCPTVAIMQWYAEFNERVTKDKLTVLVFHGADRIKSPAKMAEYDVVLSTYAVVESMYRKQTYGFKRKEGPNFKEKSILHSVGWKRVILDEAHAIKDRSCSTARAVFALGKEEPECRKWSMTGTPLQNRVGELYSLIRFLDADPFSYYFCKQCPCKLDRWKFTDRRHCDGCGHISHQHFCWWNKEILRPIQDHGSRGAGEVAFKNLGLLLDNIMIRRTKIECSDDLGLPPRIVTVRRDVFSEAEEEFYESLYSETVRTFNTFVDSDTVLNNYANIFSLLSRMRLAANHPDLVVTKLKAANSNTTTLVCGICQEEAEDAIMSKCKHVFCREDIKQYIQCAPTQATEDQNGMFTSTAKPKRGGKKAAASGPSVLCPVCFKDLSIDLSQQPVSAEDAFGKAASDITKNSSIVNRIDLTQWRSSTKIEALVQELTALQRESVTLKSIVFSQFVSFLDLIQWRLAREGFNVVKLDGRMSPIQRDVVIRKFMTDPSVTVFLVSLKAGGVALNLTEASRVYVMDPWWNGAVEDQAFDRIHRLGQHRSIKITRMIIENSIESRILLLQEKKAALFASTIGKDMGAVSKLSEEDLQFLFCL